MEVSEVDYYWWDEDERNRRRRAEYRARRRADRTAAQFAKRFRRYRLTHPLPALTLPELLPEAAE